MDIQPEEIGHCVGESGGVFGSQHVLLRCLLMITFQDTSQPGTWSRPDAESRESGIILRSDAVSADDRKVSRSARCLLCPIAASILLGHTCHSLRYLAYHSSSEFHRFFVQFYNGFLHTVLGSSPCA